MPPPLARIVEQLKREPSRTGSIVITVFGDAIVPRGGSVWLGTLLEFFKAIDMGLGMRDRFGWIGPCESDFECGKRQAVDDDRFLIGAPDPGVPQARSGLKGFDVKPVVIAGHFVLRGCA